MTEQFLNYLVIIVVMIFVDIGGFYLAWRKLKSSEPLDSTQMMQNLQAIAQTAVEAESRATMARDEAVAALEEYKRMRVADFEITIIFSLHPIPTVKDVSIRSLPDADRGRITPIVKMVEDTKPLTKSRQRPGAR
jgi:hypothetical protein